jgi:ubiquinone/menaquinone biosynthesis C-methylase UbiE
MGTPNPERFDSQAATFDDRAGLAPDVARAVADAIVEIAGAAPDDLVFEIGAGTGEIGLHLLPAVRYLGIDRSAGMLDLFRAKLGTDRSRVDLVHADADDRWPVDDDAVTAVFGSRVAHLLDADHLEAELRRVLRPGGSFLVGRVLRDPESARSRLRQQRQRVLRDHGVQPRQAEKLTEQLVARLAAGGAEVIDTRPVASWAVSTSPEEILTRWATLTSMGGVELDADVRMKILEDLRVWAERELGDLAAVGSSTERYTVGGVRFGNA